MERQNVLITGSSGSLGTVLAGMLKEAGYNVFGFDISDGKDIRNYDQVVESCVEHKIHVIVHLAAVANLNFYHEDPEWCHGINVDGTCNVLRAANVVNAWVLFASTCCAYGNNGVHPSDETAPLCPTEPYAQSKADMEPEVLESNPDNIVARLATFYGPNMRPEMAPAIFIEKIIHGDVIDVHGSGAQSRTMTHVDDVALGLLKLIENAHETSYRVFNVTTEESVSVMDMIRHISQIVHAPAILNFAPDRSFQIHEEKILSKRLQSLGWHPMFSFRDGMKDCIRHYIAHGEWTQPSGVAPPEPGSPPHQ